MARLVFSAKGGYVTRLRVAWTGWRFGIRGFAAGVGLLAEQISVGARSNALFSHTLDDSVFIYAFGQRIGDVTVSGTLFVGGCSGEDGVASVMRFYAENSVANSGKPVAIRMGQIGASKAFLIGANANVSRPDTYTGTFQLTFRALPANAPGARRKAGGDKEDNNGNNKKPPNQPPPRPPVSPPRLMAMPAPR